MFSVKKHDVRYTEASMGFFTATRRNHLVAFIAEFIGTFLFLFFSFSIAQVALSSVTATDNPRPNVLNILYIALGFGCSLAINVWLFYRVSGGMFNPAVGIQLLIGNHCCLTLIFAA
jgi:aquaporin rerated protein, other eukaryote